MTVVKFLIFTLFASYVSAQLNLLGLEVDLLGAKKTTTTPSPPVTEKPKDTCKPSETILTNGAKVCKGDLIFQEDFGGYFLDKSKWDVEQYIPIVKGPDYEFVSYQNSDETLTIDDGKLIITPVPLREDADVRGKLDLKEKCTSKLEEECYYEQVSSFILPPVKSAQVTSKFAFTYGRIEVLAKLPRGDWIFPQIQLTPRRKEKKGLKMLIAYSRGNSHFVGPRRDEGSKLLFGGPVLDPQEPERSRLLKYRESVDPYGNSTHAYTLVWQPELVTLLFDGVEYGRIPINVDDERFFPFSREFQVTLGIGVGGVNDFPDNYITNPPKPWKNFDRLQFKNFFDARETWLTTWRRRGSRLQVDSIKIWAV